MAEASAALTGAKAGGSFTQQVTPFIEKLPVSDLHREAVRSRWLDQVVWMNGRANSARRRYQVLRLTTVVGGVIVPAMISVSLGQTTTDPTLRLATFLVSLLVAVTAAVEGFAQYGDRWRNYRRTVEQLKSEGWQYFLGLGSYRKIADGEEAFRVFASRVEAIIAEDVQGYMESVQGSPTERHDVFTKV